MSSKNVFEMRHGNENDVMPTLRIFEYQSLRVDQDSQSLFYTLGVYLLTFFLQCAHYQDLKIHKNSERVKLRKDNTEKF